jgi:hypothetical protein
MMPQDPTFDVTLLREELRLLREAMDVFKQEMISHIDESIGALRRDVLEAY